MVSRSMSFKAAAAAMVLGAALVAGCGKEGPEALVKSAREFVAKKDYKAAVIQLKNALQEEPQNGEARYLLGVSLAELGDYVSAEKEFRRALEYKYPPEIVYPQLVQVMFELGDPRKIVTEVGAVTVSDPAAQAALKTVVGEAHLALRQFKEASAAFAAAQVSVPGYPRARVGEARIMATQGDLPGATKIAEDILARSPAMPEALSLKADLLLSQGKSEEAVAVLSALVKAQPVNGQARFLLASLLIDGKNFDQAGVEIDAMKKALPNDVRSRYLEALLAFKKGEPEKARAAIQQVLKVAPDHGPTLLLAGATEYQLNSFATAGDYLRKAVAKYPNSLYARNLLVATYLRSGQPGPAEEAVGYALKLAPKDPAVLRLAGEVALSNNRLADAAKYYDQAVALDKNSAASRTRLAELRLAGGDADRALLDLEAASALDASQYQADLSLVTAHLRRKEFGKARAAAVTLEKKQPNNPLTQNVKGVVYLAEGDLKSARASFEKALSLQFNYLPAARNLSVLDLAEKQPEAAKKRFETIVAKEPNNDGALLLLAGIQASTGAPSKEVTATLDRAIGANPGSVVARMALIDFLTQSRDAKAALVAAQAAGAAMPNEPRILEALGLAQVQAGDPNQAVATFNKLVNVLPQSPIPLMRLANVYYGTKQYDPAIQALRKALILQPDLLEAQREIIVVQVASGKTDEALKEARGIQKTRPKEAAGFAMEGDVLASQNKSAEGARAYAEALKRQSIPTLAVRQHQLLLAAGQSAEAEAVAAKWLRENPKDPVVRFYLGDVDLRNKDYKGAAKRNQEVLALQPENALALNNLAWSLAELKDPSAIGYAQKAYASAPTNPAIQDTYGWLLFNEGDVKRSVDLLTKAAAAAPKVAEIRMHLAKALLKSGDNAAAKRELEAIVQLAGTTPSKAEAEQLLKGL